jgi:hypothetical protein
MFHHEEQIWFEQFVCNRYQVVFAIIHRKEEASYKLGSSEEFLCALQVMQ